MRAGGDAAEHRVRRLQRQVRFRRCRHTGQQAAREAVGQRGLADAVGAGDQPGMVHPTRAHRLEQRGLGGFVAEQVRVGARFRCHGGEL